MSEVGRMVDWNPTVTSGSIIGGKECNSVFFQFETAIEVFQCCCYASHAFQFAHLGIDENPIGKHQRIAAQNVTINYWLGSNEWRRLV